MNEIAKVEIAGSYPVTLTETSRFVYEVTYSKQVRSRLSRSEAAEEFGHCVFHAAECAGLLK